MPLDLDHFCRSRPFLYHLTAAGNVPRIRHTRVLESAALLARQAGNDAILQVRRRQSVVVRIGGDDILIRDQAPLHEGNVRFQNGWDFHCLLRELNRRVFFWPGRAESGMIDYGRRHYLRYQEENPRIIRVETRAVVEANAGRQPLFCKFNSGSPRCTGGRGSPRGPETFVAGTSAGFGISDVVEVTFMDRVALPAGTKVGDAPDGPWDELA